MARIFNPDTPAKDDKKAHAMQVHPVRRKSTEYLDDIAALAANLRNIGDKIEKVAKKFDEQRKSGKGYEVTCMDKHASALHEQYVNLERLIKGMKA